MHNPFASKTNLIVHTQHPYNAEPKLHRLRAAMITAQADFYVRSHGDIPQLDLADHRLRVSGRVATQLNLSVPELRQRFAEHTVTAVMQCAGNRRADMQTVRPTSGDPWAPGAIGNAAWTGIALADVLRAVGADEDAALHVAFEACDEVEMPNEGRFRYGASIPMTKAMSPEVLLAYAMNGAPLAAEHGFPLRVVVPGFAGVRSPKWLASITVQDAPAANHMQQRDYKLVPPEMTAGYGQLGTGLHDQRNAVECRNLRTRRRTPSLRPAPCHVRGYAVATARACRAGRCIDERRPLLGTGAARTR